MCVVLILSSLVCLQLEEELSGVVEIIGTVSNKGVIMASTYSILREDRGTVFGTAPSTRSPPRTMKAALTACVVASADLELYNEALKVLQDFPQFYPFHTTESG